MVRLALVVGLALLPIPVLAQVAPTPSPAPSATAPTQASSPGPVSPEASPQASSAAPSPEASPAGGFDMSKLTPQQREALQAAIIKLSQNPVGNIATVPLINNFNYGVGPYARFQYNLDIQPVIPIMLGGNWNLIARTIIPLVNNPSFAPPRVCASVNGCGSTFGIGDVQEQLYFAPKTKPGALIWGAGPQFQAPTASPGTLGSGKWSAGPALAGVIMPGHIVAGVLLTQLWSFAGEANRPNVSLGLLEPFINYNLKGGWSIATVDIMTVDWTAPKNKWAIPLGGGVTKTFKFAEQPMQISVQYYSYVARQVFSPQTELKVNWVFLFPIKRGIDIPELIKENQ